MNVGKTLFAQVMEFVPWKTFGRIVERHRGDAGVRTLGEDRIFKRPFPSPWQPGSFCPNTAEDGRRHPTRLSRSLRVAENC